MTKREGGENTLILYHASKEVVEYPEVRKMKYTKDFSWGFYCTKKLDQAVRWANRGEGEPIINIYQYDPDDSLQVLYFETMTEEWLDFIARCRSGKTHRYDIVEGPMADDTIYNYIQNFMDGKISRAAFWELVKFKYPTHQISFHTISALDTLTFIGSEVVHGNKK